MCINKALKFVYVVSLVTIVTTFLIITMYNMLPMVSMATNGYHVYRTSIVSTLCYNLTNSCIRHIAVTNFTNMRWPTMPKLIPVFVKTSPAIHTLKQSDGRT